MKKIMLSSGISLAILLILLTTTEPSKVPSFVLVLPFILLFIILLGATSRILQTRGMEATRSWRIGALLSGVPLTLLILQSIGQLTARDLLTIGALFLLSYFYITRVTTRA